MKDSFDQVVTCQSVAALKAYDHAVDCQLHAWPGAPAAIERALEHDPDFALAHSTRALLLLSAGRGAEARAASKQALLLAKALTEREQSHWVSSISYLKAALQQLSQAFVHTLNNGRATHSSCRLRWVHSG